MKVIQCLPSPETVAGALQDLRLANPCVKILVPEEAIQRLYEVARHDTGQSQAARRFLFWLVGKDSPGDGRGQGALELRRMDKELRESAIEVLTWWGSTTKRDEPIYRVLRELAGRVAKG